MKAKRIEGLIAHKVTTELNDFLAACSKGSNATV